MIATQQRRELLKAVLQDARTCTACPLHASRTQVVFGAGNADAELMFIGEAPGATEDLQGLPFVGQAGKLLDQLLGEIGMARAEVFIANTVKCRPPGNRDPHPHEIEACSHFLFRQLDLIAPTVVCTLGNFATKLLRNDVTGISQCHGQAEIITIGTRAVRLFPLYHPAAALYAPSTLDLLRADFQRIPEILALGAPRQPEREPVAAADAAAVAEPATAVAEPAVTVAAPGATVAESATSVADPLGAVDGAAAITGEPEQLGLF
ncbi:MAG: uracil-DNA glycosylase [Solirubrobacteraceae bacterium]